MRAPFIPKRPLAAIAASLTVLCWAATVGARPGYPKIIDTTLALTGNEALETVYQPMGCQLCHNSSAGGDSLKAFGNLMVENYGLSASLTAEEDPTLTSALVLLQSDNPEAVKDLKAGVDPNNDPVVFQNALPSPEYGCSAGPFASRASSLSRWLPLAGLVAVLTSRRRRRLAPSL